jgi:hypothetical protein
MSSQRLGLGHHLPDQFAVLQDLHSSKGFGRLLDEVAQLAQKVCSNGRGRRGARSARHGDVARTAGATFVRGGVL